MASPLIKRGLLAIGALLTLVAAAVIALPFVASTQLVRDRIALELSAWSGYEVRIGAPPEIEVWPSFRAILTEVTLTPWIRSDGAPVLAAERVEFNLSAVAALRGRVEFSSARLIRPTLAVERRLSGLYLPAPPGGGRMADSIDKARAVVAMQPEAPNVGALPADPFGTIEVSDGRVVVLSSGDPDEIVTGLSGQLIWTALNRAATLSAKGVWRGETATVELSSPAPLLLLAGGNAPFKISLNAAPATAGFDGTVTLGENPYFQGQGNVAAPSLRRALEWSRSAVPAGASIGSLSASSRITGDPSRVKFENTEITLDGNPGMGALELSLAETLPTISGTLAFDTLDLRSLLSAFMPLDQAGNMTREIDTAFASRLDLDLRLSAAHATAGSIALEDVAATAQVKGGLAAFDISDAAAFGGTVQAGVRFDRKTDGTSVELRLLASDIEGGAFGTAAGMSRLVPIGKGTISMILKGPGRAWDQFLDKADGSISANFGVGALAGLDIDAFLKRAAQGGFFPLAEISSNSLPIESMELKATVASGVLRLDRADVKTAQRKIVLSGIMPFAGRGLALSGVVAPQQPATGAAAPVRNEAAFFVGGTWSAPFISPIYPVLQME